MLPVYEVITVPWDKPALTQNTAVVLSNLAGSNNWWLRFQLWCGDYFDAWLEIRLWSPTRGLLWVAFSEKSMGSTLAQAREDARAVSWGLCSDVALWESSLFFISYFVSLVSPPSLLTQPKVLRPIRENIFNCFPSLPLGKGWWRKRKNGPFLSWHAVFLRKHHI